MAGLSKWLSDPIGATIDTVTNSKTVKDGTDAIVDGVAKQFESACDAPARDTSVPVMDCKALDDFDFDKVEDILKTIPADKINITSAKSELGEFLQKAMSALGHKTGVDGAAGGGTVEKLNDFFREKVASEAESINPLADKFADLKILPVGSKGITHLTGRHVQAIVNELMDRGLLDKDQVMARELGEGLSNIDSPELAALADQLAPKKSELVEPKADATATTPDAAKTAAVAGSGIAVPSSSLLGTIEDGLKDNVSAADLNVSSSKPTDMGRLIQETLNRLNADNGMDDKIPVTGIIDEGTILKLNEAFGAKVAKEAGNLTFAGFDNYAKLKSVESANDLSGYHINAILNEAREQGAFDNDPALVKSLSKALDNDVGGNFALDNAAKELMKPPEPDSKIDGADIKEGAAKLLNLITP